MGARVCRCVGVLGLAICGLAACVKPVVAEGAKPASVAEGAATPAAGDVGEKVVAEPTGDVAEVPAPETPEPEAPASAELDWVESPLQADLDGDGAPESIKWSCGGTLRLTVGRARVREEYKLVEEMGCVAAVVALRPGDTARQLAIAIADHDEVGPGLCFVYAYREGKLELVWSDEAGVDFLVDGSWTTETSDCYEDEYRATQVGRHRWDGNEVTSEVREDRTPVEPGDCAEP